MKFRAKSENEQSRLSDDELVDYLDAARGAGQDAEVRRASGILASRRTDVLAGIVRNRIGSASDEDVEDIVSTVMEQTIKARFEGRHAGQFFRLMLTILDRRIIDFIDRQRREPKAVVPDEDGDDPVAELVDSEDPVGAAALRMTLDNLLGHYSPCHRMVIELRIDGIPSKEAAERARGSGVDGCAKMTGANVDQIYKRFRDRHSDELDPGGSAGGKRSADDEEGGRDVA